MTTAPIRSQCKRRLFDLLTVNLPGVAVTYAEPPSFQPLCVWLGATNGSLRPAGLAAGRKPRFDEFAVELHCLAYQANTDDWQVLDEAVEGLWAQVDSLVAESPTLSENVTAIDGLLYAKVTEVNGPVDGMLVLEDKVAGYSAEIIGSVMFTSHLR